jgi:hypothetical protein
VAVQLPQGSPWCQEVQLTCADKAGVTHPNTVQQMTHMDISEQRNNLVHNPLNYILDMACIIIVIIVIII